ncbi:MAG TPA: MFS transporter [Sedimentisphaerales bacterium]|nr:MFS transporter [Sedimentisphaerales bacterium]HQG48307.1 MFS transporter [Sedimentisphaerales bacterium]
MQDGSQKLSVVEKVGYGLGDTASNLFFQITIYFLAYYFTDVYGLKATDLALMFLITRIWDAINDPIMGWLADKANTRWGKYRPFLLWCSVPFGLAFILMFTVPAVSYGGKVAYAYVTYTLMMMVYTAINVPYAALMGVITPDSTERTTVSTYRFVLVFIAQFIVQYALPLMVNSFGGGNESLGYQRAVMVLATGAAVLFLVTFLTTRERVRVSPSQKSSFKTNLTDLVGNVPWLMIGGATVFQLTFIVMRSSNIQYYFKYVVGGQELHLCGKVYELSGGQLSSSFMLTGTFATIIGAILTGLFVNRFSKKTIYAGFMLLTAVTSALVYYLAPEQLILLFLLQIVTSFSMGPVSVLQWAIYTDTADYQEWKFGRRSTAFIMAASLFALKLGVAFGGALLGWILAHYEYVSPVEQAAETIVQQSETALKGITLCMSVYPAIIALGCVVLMAFYPLNKSRMAQMESELIERRK